MMKAVAVIALALFAAVSADLTFDQWTKIYNKQYEASEYTTRMATYNANVKAINARRAEMIANGEEPWMGINEYTDMTAEQFKQSGRVMANNLPAADAKSCLANGVTADYSAISFDVPSEFDWRTKNVVSPIQDQQQCGSCWAFSTASVIESAHAIKSGKLDKLSEQEIVDCSHACIKEDGEQVCNQGCNGGWMWSAMTDIIAWKGLETEKEYPYTAETDTCVKKAAEGIDAITNYTCLSGPKKANETDMVAYLVANGPLSIAMDAGILQTYTSGIIKPASGDCSTTSLDHAILIVGYGVDAGVDFWIIRNSWGLSWGEAGYFRIIRNKGACGLNTAVVFPTVA